MEFIPVGKHHFGLVKEWLPELGNFYDGHKNSKFFEQITDKEEKDPFGYFTLRKEIWSAVVNKELLNTEGEG